MEFFHLSWNSWVFDNGRKIHSTTIPSNLFLERYLYLNQKVRMATVYSSIHIEKFVKNSLVFQFFNSLISKIASGTYFFRHFFLTTYKNRIDWRIPAKESYRSWRLVMNEMNRMFRFCNEKITVAAKCFRAWPINYGNEKIEDLINYRCNTM